MAGKGSFCESAPWDSIVETEASYEGLSQIMAALLGTLCFRRHIIPATPHKLTTCLSPQLQVGGSSNADIADAADVARAVQPAEVWFPNLSWGLWLRIWGLGLRMVEGCIGIQVDPQIGQTPLGLWLLHNPLPRILLPGAVVFGSTLGNFQNERLEVWAPNMSTWPFWVDSRPLQSTHLSLGFRV